MNLRGWSHSTEDVDDVEDNMMRLQRDMEWPKPLVPSTLI